jgi:hypothetical protein
MVVLALERKSVAEAAEAAAAELVYVRRHGGSSFINLPIIYPDGSFVTLKLDQSGSGIRVSDNGFAYRELEAIGAGRSFAKTASAIAEPLELLTDRRSVYADVSEEQLVRAICDVGLASWQIADRIYARAAEEDEAEIEDHLRTRLTKVFGNKLKAADQNKIKGASTSEWEVSAIVDQDGKQTVFHAVSNHANSVFRTSAAFHDLLALQDLAPNVVAVVRSKAALGPRFGILAQAGAVIEEDQPDEVYRRAAA